MHNTLKDIDIYNLLNKYPESTILNCISSDSIIHYVIEKNLLPLPEHTTPEDYYAIIHGNLTKNELLHRLFQNVKGYNYFSLEKVK